MKFHNKVLTGALIVAAAATVRANTPVVKAFSRLLDDSLKITNTDSTFKADSAALFYNKRLDSLSKALDEQLRAFHKARFGTDTLPSGVPDSSLAQIAAGIQRDYDTTKAKLDCLKSALDSMKQKGYVKSAKAKKLKKEITKLERKVEGIKKSAETWIIALVDTSKTPGAPDTPKTAGTGPDSLKLSGLAAEIASAKAAVDSATAATIGRAGRAVRKAIRHVEGAKLGNSPPEQEVKNAADSLSIQLYAKETALEREYRLDSLSYALDSLLNRINAAKTAGEVTKIGDELNDISKKVNGETKLGDDKGNRLADKLAQVQKQFGKKQDEMGGYSN